MTRDISQTTWSAEPVDPILLNILTDELYANTTALSNNPSLKLVERAYDATIGCAQKQRFETAADKLRSEGDGLPSEECKLIEEVVTAVRESLSDEGVIVTITHENVMTVEPDQALVYTFSRTRDPSQLTDLDMSDAAMDPITKASEHISDQEWISAANTINEAVMAAVTIREEVVTRTLSALCYHWGGDDQRAIDLVSEAVSLDPNTWLPWFPGYSADADPAYATSDQFRTNKYGVSVFLRYIAKVPDRASVTPFIGRESNGGVQWNRIESTSAFSPIERLDETTYIRFQVQGPIDAFPVFQAYYVGLGIIDLEVNEIKDVLKTLENGPKGERVTETVQFEKRA